MFLVAITTVDHISTEGRRQIVGVILTQSRVAEPDRIKKQLTLMQYHTELDTTLCITTKRKALSCLNNTNSEYFI